MARITTKTARPQSEREILQQLAAELEAKLEDPMCDDFEQATQLLANTHERLKLLDESVNVAGLEQPLVDADGAKYVVNESGYGEPDIASEKQGDKVLTPPEVAEVQAKTEDSQVRAAVFNRRRAAAEVTTRDYDDVVAYAATLGISANDTHALWSEMQADFGTEWTLAAYWALKQYVLNRFLLKQLHDVESIFHNMTLKLSATKSK